MGRSLPHIVLLLVLLISLRGNLGSNSGVGEPRVKCKEAERQALLRIKQDLFVSSSFWSPEEDEINILLSSWGDEAEKRECCDWIGIRCNNISGHVIKLDLSPSTFQAGDHSVRGNISSSLVDLKHLTYLDLSDIDFGDFALAKFSSIPSFIGSLTKLQHLCLSSTSLGGEIPPQLGNLSSLQFLDLSYNHALKIKSLNWISRLPSLQVLDLSGTNMSLANDWVHVVSRNLPRSLTILSLFYCDLPYTPVTPASLSLVNSSKVLKVLDLSANPLISKSIFQWLFSYSHSLVQLDLSFCDIGGPIPNGFNNMTALEYLDLSNNMFQGNAIQLGNLSSLQFLDLSHNGSLKIKSLNWISRLPSLQVLDLSGTNMSLANDWVHVVSRNLPRSLTKLSLFYCDLPYTPVTPASLSLVNSSKVLKVLDLSANPLISKSIFQWLFSYSHSLVQLELWLCDIGGPIPNGFNNMTALKYLDLSYNMFQGILSERFGNLNSLVYLDLQGNQLDSLNPKSFVNMTAMKYLYLQSNHLKGPIPENFGNNMRSLRDLDLSNNMLEGEIPKSIWKICSLQIFVAYNNSLSGLLRFAQTNSFMSCANFSLEHLDLNHNKITGSLPNFTLYPYLSWLNLSFNLLTGISKSIGQLSKLKDMNISYNSIQGVMSETHFAKWLRTQKDHSTLGGISDWLYFNPNLGFLDVSYNQLSGEIPDCWSQASSLQILILANNNLSGKIPVSIGFLKNVDLSRNKLTGEIPRDITKLAGLISFNLSRNNLSGHIPHDIGQLQSLVALDLSYNHLSGQIPPSLSLVDSLGTLDVSNNNLSGKIPTGTQLQTQFISAFLGNPELCGDPLPKKCPNEEYPSLTGRVTEDGDKDDFFTKGFYISLAMGVVVGFWGFCGTFIFNKSFRYAYLKLLNDIEDWLYVTKEIHGRKLLRFIQS